MNYGDALLSKDNDFQDVLVSSTIPLLSVEFLVQPVAPFERR
jgi:hypothetical protein